MPAARRAAGRRNHPNDPAGASTYLYWPIRASFLSYVAGLPDGRASVSDGATLTHAEPQEAVYISDPTASGDGVLAFGGDLRLAGHGGLLFIRVARPWLELGPGVDRGDGGAGGEAQLTIDDPFVEGSSGVRMRLVTLRVHREGDIWSGTDVRLAPEGTRLFNDMYPAGTPFDPLRVTAQAPGSPGQPRPEG